MIDLREETKEVIQTCTIAAALLEGVTLERGFVVRCLGQFLVFTVGTEGRIQQPRLTLPCLATHLTRIEAERVAAAVKSQTDYGQAGVVMHVRDALRQVIETKTVLLAALDSSESQVMA